MKVVGVPYLFLLALLSLGFFSAPSTTEAANASGLPWLSGYWAEGGASLEEMTAFATWRGRPLDIAELFISLKGGEAPATTWAKFQTASVINSISNYYNAGYKVTMTVPLITEESAGKFGECANTTNFEGYHRTVANRIHTEVGDNVIYLRLGHEATGGYPWSYRNHDGAGPDPADPTDYKNCWNKISHIYKAAIPNVKMVWNHLKSHTLPMERYYPGDDAVDVIGIDPYDNCDGTGCVNSEAEWTQFEGRYEPATGFATGLDGLRLFARAHGKKLSLCEWGPSQTDLEPNYSPSHGSNNSFYVARMFRYLSEHAADIEYEITYNGKQHLIYPKSYFLPLASDAYKAAWAIGAATTVGTAAGTTVTTGTTVTGTTGTAIAGTSAGTNPSPKVYCTERYTSAVVPANGYGASYNVFNSEHELLLRLSCNPAGDATFTVDTPDTATTKYVYKNGYRWNGASWVGMTFTGTPAPGDAGKNWLTMGASTTTPNYNLRPQNVYTFFAAYTCTFANAKWNCGCRDTYCVFNGWQIQAIRNPIGNQIAGGGNTGGTTAGTTVGTTAGTTGPVAVATPVITPPGGYFNPTQSVTITDSTADAVIHYTLDGTDPTQISPTYTAPFTLTATTTVKAKAWKTGSTESAIATAVFTKGAPAAVVQKNILIVLLDDIGLDVSSFYPVPPRVTTTPASPPTPNLRTFAGRGIIFDNAWATPSCSPTRATIMTGRYGFRTKIGYPVAASAGPGLSLQASELTLPEAFKAVAGNKYMLSLIGKWHLGGGRNEPNNQGWDYFAGGDPTKEAAHLRDYFSWDKVVNGVPSHSTTYGTTDVVNETIGRINAAAAAGKPYLIWTAFNAAHSPFHTPPAALHPQTPDTSTDRKKFEAMLEAIDTEFGRLMAAVNLDTTTVILLGDNGTPNEVLANPFDLNHGKLTVYEEGMHVPIIIAGAGVVGAGRRVGGLVQSTDIFPTVLDLGGVNRATVLAGKTIDGVTLMPYISNTGTSGRTTMFTEIFKNGVVTDQFEHAIRNNRYKLIERATGIRSKVPPVAHPYTGILPVREFFDLQTDPRELNNLFGKTLTTEQQSNLDSLNATMADLVGVD